MTIKKAIVRTTGSRPPTFSLGSRPGPAMPCRLSRGPAGCDGMLVAEHAVGKAKEIAAKDVDPAGCSVFQWAAGRSREASSTTFGRCRAIDGCSFGRVCGRKQRRSEEHTSELKSLMRISYAV